jgi:hypothetical protein
MLSQLLRYFPNQEGSGNNRLQCLRNVKLPRVRIPGASSTLSGLRFDIVRSLAVCLVGLDTRLPSIFEFKSRTGLDTAFGRGELKVNT